MSNVFSGKRYIVAGVLIGLAGIVFLATRGLAWPLTVTSFVLSIIYVILGIQNYPGPYPNWFGGSESTTGEATGLAAWSGFLMDGIHIFVFAAISVTAVLLLLGL